MTYLNRVFFSFSILLVFCACATNMPKQFSLLQIGMEKDEVLTMMESPQRTQRWKGQDRWTYIFYDDNNQRQEKEVHFENGRAVYVGDSQTPAISAAKQDEANEQSNTNIEKLFKEQKQQQEQSYPKYEESIKGSDQIRYVPQFTPVQ